ncbi:polysaccharide deacetylase family protein [Heyndrickxia sporothermodurans]|nr:MULTISPECIES: polysaccharide deacetylase family protein [Bacillaceae]SLL13147.1 polysaccharide deacetylase [Mycobacteroides abscessus subsp. abscessus]HEO8422759.1 polysaccharide deacetylase family protein [Yersinia enterocolitica]KAB7665721.1 polysaccharide deacetylase family protein [Bacillus sp. B1-b2]MBZ9537214.1 polysaccharide deacetylase family protein [Cytobacillus oceanisediminis]MEB6551274.1 polysaccharide deacetylase family protein [Heyndrickxia sporothermodurans]
MGILKLLVYIAEEFYEEKNSLILIVFLSTFILTITDLIGPFNTIGSGTAALKEKNDELYKEIKVYREEHKIEPIDAKVDRVWKAIPGYNGLDVDIESSYKKMKSDGNFHKNKVVYKEKPPNVHLENLAPIPIYKGNPEKPMVALLINVAWGNEYIPTILTTLKESKVKATFFFDGSWVKKNPDLAKMIYREGHEIGNHAYSHLDLKKRSKSDTIQELEKTNALIEETIGIKPKWFAPPSGLTNPLRIFQ